MAKQRTAAQRAATARMIAANKAKRGGSTSGASRKARKGRARKGKASKSKGLATRGAGLKRAHGGTMLSFLPFTEANTQENLRRMATGLAVVGHHSGENRAAIKAMEGKLIARKVLSGRFNFSG